jgi:hypothetical protein
MGARLASPGRGGMGWDGSCPGRFHGNPGAGGMGATPAGNEERPRVDGRGSTPAVSLIRCRSGPTGA